jgi:hypothetical protein
MNSKDVKTFTAEIKAAKKADNFDQMLVLARQALQEHPGESKFLDLLHDAQAYYVNAKLDSDVVHQLEEKQDWNTLEGVYLKLLGVFPESHKLKKLLAKTKKKIQKGQTAEEKAYYQGLQTQVKDLAKKGELDSALQACYEFLSHYPEDETFLRLAEKVERKRGSQIEKSLTAYFKEAVPKLKAEYKAHKADFIRV